MLGRVKRWRVDIEYRWAVESELERVLDFRRQMFASMPGIPETALADERWKKNAKIFLAQQLGSEAFARVALGGETIVGSTILTVHSALPTPMQPSMRRGWVSGTWVKESHRRMGIASVLMQGLIDKAKELGLEDIGLNSTPLAIGVYQALGFRVAGHLDNPEMRLVL